MVQQQSGTVHWIDHYTIGTSDLAQFIDFHERVLGAQTEPADTPRPPGIVFQHVASCHHGGFMQRQPMPSAAPPGRALPRYAYFVRPEDLDEHVRRLDANHVPHTDPVRTATDGADGIAVYFVDPDGNQFEFWAPDRMPEGAMRGSGPMKVGRISHVVYEARDLERTAAFFKRFCALEPLRRADAGADTLVLPLAAGGRLVYKRVEALGERTSGRGIYRDLHTALVVREEDFWHCYERVWAELPEWDFDQRVGPPPSDGENLPARTALHGSPAGRAWKAVFGRGDDWYDWDTNLFHFFVGVPQNGTMTAYEPHAIDDYMAAYLASRGLRLPMPVAELYRQAHAQR